MRTGGAWPARWSEFMVSDSVTVRAGNLMARSSLIPKGDSALRVSVKSRWRFAPNHHRPKKIRAPRGLTAVRTTTPDLKKNTVRGHSPCVQTVALASRKVGVN